jgi:hypothetical protein
MYLIPAVAGAFTLDATSGLLATRRGFGAGFGFRNCAARRG